MDYNNKVLANESNLSQMCGSRFLDSFSSNIIMHRGNGQPCQKKPKLDIDKSINLSGSTSSRNIKKNGDIFDDLWGDDPDSTLLEKVDFDETQAQSQMLPGTMPVQSSTGMVLTQCNMSRPPQSSQKPQSFVSRGNNNKPGCINNKAVTTRNSPTVPLRRTASSGWPTTNSFSQSEFIMGSRNQLGKRSSDVSTIGIGLEAVHLENENLKEKLNRKTGEANLLRDRLTSLQQELSKEKNEHKEKIDAVKQEAEKKIVYLSKEIKSLKGQLDVKDMEIETAEKRAQHMSSLKRIHPESPNNIRQSSIKSVFSPARTHSKQIQINNQLMYGRSQLGAKSLTLSFELLKQQITPDLLKPSQPEAPILESVRTITNPGLLSTEPRDSTKSVSGHSSKSDFFTAESRLQSRLKTQTRQPSIPCSLMESCIFPLLSSKLMDISTDNAHQTISQVLKTCVQILKDQLSQLVSAVGPQNRCVEREWELLYCGYKYLMLKEEYNLLSNKELYSNERGISARRILALLSLLVEVSDFAATQMLPSLTSTQPNQNENEATTDATTSRGTSTTDDSHAMLHILRDIVCQIEKQRRTLIFQGLLAGATALIKSLLQSDMTLSQHSQEIMLHILRGIVFARPGCLVIRNILQIVLAATKYPYLTDSICHNSAKKTFVENTRQSIISFTSDTCILQALCMQIQLVETPKKHILSDVFTSWVLTLFYGSQQSPDWLFSDPAQRFCQCRPFISRLSFTLLAEACTVYPSVSEDSHEKKLLETLLTRGILLVYTLLNHDEHYNANIDPASLGYYELFLNSMKSFNLKLNKSCCEILEILCIQEGQRQNLVKPIGDINELSSLLSALYCGKNSWKPEDILDFLDKC